MKKIVDKRDHRLYFRNKSGSKEERLELRLTTAELIRFRATAALRGISVSEWIRATCSADAIDEKDVEMLRENARSKRP